MRIVVILLIFLALFAAGGTAFLAKRFLDTQKQVQNEQKGTPSTASNLVIVANTNLAAGTVLRGTSIKWQPWPDEGVSDTYISAEKEDKKLEKGLIGLVLRSGVLAGTPLTKKMVFKRENAGFLAGALNPGKRAVAVAVTATSGASGFILPGDYVDVVLSFKIPSSSNFNAEEKEALKTIVLDKTAETIVTKVRVLAIGQKFNNIAAEAEVVKTVTLEVSSKQSETLALAASMGKISLVLRSLTKSEQVKNTTGFTSDLQISSTLRGVLNKTKDQNDARASLKKSVKPRAKTGVKSGVKSATKAPAKKRRRVRTPRKRETVNIYRGTAETTQEIPK